MKRISVMAFSILMYVSLTAYNYNCFPYLQLQKHDFLFSLNEKENIIIENFILYSKNGEFNIDDRPIKLNEYTFDLLFENKIIGRYSDGNGNIKNMYCELYTSNKYMRNKIGLHKLISLKKIDKKSFQNEIKEALKSYPNEFFTNPEILNNKGFFLYKYKYYNEALIYLNKTKELFPNRIVVYLNLADCYWELDKKNDAKIAYKKYISLMKSEKKNLKKVPQRVVERTR